MSGESGGEGSGVGTSVAGEDATAAGLPAWRSAQLVRAGVEPVFTFLADARNLNALTPPWMRFRILTPMPVAMEVGARIDYRLRFRGLPLPWRSEIVDWDPPRFFAYEQRRGPYRSWRHEHRFTVRSDGTLCEDLVLYRVRGGAPLRRLWVEPHLRWIFDHRNRVLRERFGGPGPV